MARLLLATLIILLLAACAGNQQQRERDSAVERWEEAVRWSQQYDVLLDYIHPEWLAENPVSMLDINRLNQFRVTEYRVRQVVTDPDDLGFQRVVQIRLYH